MDLTVLQPQFERKPTALSTEWCKIGLHGTWQSCCPVPQTIACSFIVARQIKFRNKIPTFSGLSPPVAEGIFERGAASRCGARVGSLPIFG